MAAALYRGLPATEEGTPDTTELPEGGAAHNNLLRIALQGAQDLDAACRGVRCRPPGCGSEGDIETARGERAWNACRACAALHGKRTAWRVCSSGGRCRG